MAKQKNKTIQVHRTFDSIYHFCRYVGEGTGEEHYSRTYPKRKDFCPLSFDEWVDTIENGTVEGYEDFEFSFRKASEALRRHYDRAIVGQFYDIAGLLHGDPDSGFVSTRTRNTFHVSMFISTAFSCNTHAESIKHRAIAALALAEKIESSGGTVSMHIIKGGTYCSHSTYEFSYQFPCVTPMELYLAMQPATLRRGGFGLLEIITGKTDCHDDAYGIPSTKIDIDKTVQNCVERGDIVLTMDSNVDLVHFFEGNIVKDIDTIFNYSHEKTHNDSLRGLWDSFLLRSE